VADAEQISMSGTLKFTHGGTEHTAQATVTATRLSAKRWTCNLQVTLRGFPARNATFTVSASAAQQGTDLEAGIAAAIKSWPRPWNELTGVEINLTLDQ
jgi:hypothetical protein